MIFNFEYKKSKHENIWNIEITYQTPKNYKLEWKKMKNNIGESEEEKM